MVIKRSGYPDFIQIKKEGLCGSLFNGNSRMEETTHLLSTEDNAKRLVQGIAADKEGNVRVQVLEGTRFYGKKKSSLKGPRIRPAV